MVPNCFDLPPTPFTVLGGVKLSGLDRLRVTLKLEWPHGGGYPLRQGLDLYRAAQVEELARRASEYLDIERTAVRDALAALTDALETYRLHQIDALTAPEHTPPTL